MKLRKCALITSIIIFFAVVESVFAKYSGGSGTQEAPYQIATAQDLIDLGNEPNDYDKHFIMTADIDLDPNVTGIIAFPTSVIAPEGEPEFTGVFDGNNLTISNLTIDDEGVANNYIGLFGKINLAIIKNLGLENVFVSGLDSSYVGGLVGYSDRSWNDRGSISNCYSTGSVIGNDYVGGLTGYNNRNKISNCYSTSSVDGNDYVGGLVGYNTNVISNCYATGSVYGNDYVGGLVGSISLGSITNCYSNSQVNGNHIVGGLVGENIDSYKHYCVISNCYATGIVTGNEDVGGLAGYSNYDNVMNCFWDYETSGQLESAGGYGLPTDLMKIKAVYTFFDWEFEGDIRTKPVWVIRDGISYPHLNMLEGQGTLNEPYLISSPVQFITIGHQNYYWDKHFKLLNDIDLNGSQLQVIGRNDTDPFEGTFDGGGHVISNFNINSSGQDYVGLFGYVENALIHDLGLENFYIDANDAIMVGSIAGKLDHSTISNCHATGLVNGNDYVGGLTGINHYSSITSSFSAVMVTGNNQVGGLVGQNYWSSITKCYSTDSVKGNVYVGGLVGCSFSDAEIANCYSTGSVVGNDNVGGLVGIGYALDVRNCFWDIETSGQSESAGGTGKTTAQMQDINTFLNEGWDFISEQSNGTCDFWYILDGNYPQLTVFSEYVPIELQGSGTIDDPYLIYDANDLGTLWYRPEAHYRLESDIDLSNITWNQAVVPQFEGSFDGNNHIILSLHIEGNDYLGLFGITQNAEIFNLTLESVDINGISDYIGGLVGYSNNGSITSCYTTGIVSGTRWYLGGLVGLNSSSITSSYSKCTVYGDIYIGGLVGNNYSGEITNCYSAGSVNGNIYVGGLVGLNGGMTSTGITTIGLITNCFSISSVFGYEYVGGFIGKSRGGGIKNCFWDTETSGQSKSASGTGKTTAEMQDINTFLDAGWDFIGETDNGTEDIWWIDNGQDYPRLWWEMETDN